jgi:hypothetical protein
VARASLIVLASQNAPIATVRDAKTERDGLLRGRAGAEHVFLDLAGGVHREALDDLDGTRHLLIGHRAARPLDELVGLQLGAPRGHHERHAHLAEAVVGDADDRNLRNP